MLFNRRKIMPWMALMMLPACGLTRCSPPKLSESDVEGLYKDPLTPLAQPMSIYHLGHSLVGRDMPAMLAQLAGTGYSYNSQLGWGSPLKSHWEPSVEINGFEAENDHPLYRDAKEALTSGGYDAVVLTEMVEIKDAIKYHDSPDYLAKWADLAWSGNPNAHVYLYETWHPIDDADGWLTRLDRDLGAYWEGQILDPAIADDADRRAIYVIPAGQVMAAFMRAVAERGGLEDISANADLFKKRDDGSQDPIHLNHLGMYLVALTHFSCLAQKDPRGLPFALKLADGSDAVAPQPDTAALMQDTVWQVVTNYPRTGLPQAK
jgi:hypothetical protein